MKERFFVIGGIAYRQMVHTRHLGAVVSLAGQSMAARAEGAGLPVFSDIEYQHSSALPQARCLWLREHIANKSLKWAVSVDSDTVFNAGDLLHEMSIVDGQTAMGIAPVRIGGTRDTCNLILDADDERLSEQLSPSEAPHGKKLAWGAELKRVFDGDRHIRAGGFGVVVFNLDWYRGSWPEPAPEHCSIHTGEDVEHCRSVRERGGIIKALKVQTDHFAWGEEQRR